MAKTPERLPLPPPPPPGESRAAAPPPRARTQPPIGSYPSWEDKNPIRRTALASGGVAGAKLNTSGRSGGCPCCGGTRGACACC